MRILFFTENLRAGGKERRIVGLLKQLRQTGFAEIELVLAKNIIHYEEIHTLGIPVHIIERKFIKKDPSLFFRFYRIAKRFNPDIIHVWGHMVAFYAVPTKILLRKPLINNEIVDATLNTKLLFKNLVFSYSDRVIANSYAGLKAYHAPMHKSRVIYNGFSFERLQNLKQEPLIRDQFSIRSQFVIAMVASFLEYKDYTTYIQAAMRILDHRRDITFLCIGDGDDSPYRVMVSDSYKEHIRFLGRQMGVESIMNICDAGVLATDVRFHGEGISNALMEFMALGKPVVTTRFGGSVELVEDGVNGFLVNPFDADELAMKVGFLIDHPGERERMGNQALKTIREKFSMEVMMNSFREEYLNAVKTHNA